MAEVSETTLPGVGVRYDYVTSAGVRIGVLVHRTGRRDLLVYSAVDPDACVAQLSFDPDDARTLAGVAGGDADAYVLLLAIAGPIMTRFADRLVPRQWQGTGPPGSVPNPGTTPPDRLHGGGYG
jgi:hypothetical protein